MAETGKSHRAIRKRANMLIKKNRLAEARELYVSICKDYVTDSAAWLELATINRRLGLCREAEYCARHVLSMQPLNCSALVEYGASLHYQRRLPEAIEFYKRALEIKPDYSEGHYFLATAYLHERIIDEAIKHYKKTIDLVPTHIEALNNLSAIFTEQGKIKESLELLERAFKIQPNGYRLMINEARSHLYAGDSGKALKILKKVVGKYPNEAEAYSKYLLCLNYLPQPGHEKVVQEHIRWADIHTKNIMRYAVYKNSLVPERQLRIGYVSPDFKTHSVAYFIEPIISSYNKEKFSIYCYADVPKPDDTSRRLESLCDEWLLTSYMSNEQLAERIRSDSIDILVDLAGHTGNNRLAMFARKPAPIQIGYLGYPNTTGLAEIDYRLTDSIVDPSESADRYYTETLVRLPGCFLCYQSPKDAPDIRIVSRQTAGDTIFGSFNNLAKITTEVIGVWSNILKTVKSSRLLFKSKATSDPYTRSRMVDLFAQQGVDESRLLFLDYARSNNEHLDTYNQIDIALDTFPYNGTTTTCEALWMGVPVITLKGSTHAGRVSCSILNQLGLNSFVGNNPDQYISIAVGLAEDVGQRADLHSRLRDMMRASNLCDGRVFSQNLEAAYRTMWKKYCVNTSPGQRK